MIDTMAIILLFFYICRFAANLISSGLPVLLSVKNDGNNSQIIVNCEKISIGSLLVKEIKNALSR